MCDTSEMCLLYLFGTKIKTLLFYPVLKKSSEKQLQVADNLNLSGRKSSIGVNTACLVGKCLKE